METRHEQQRTEHEAVLDKKWIKAPPVEILKEPAVEGLRIQGFHFQIYLNYFTKYFSSFRTTPNFVI